MDNSAFSSFVDAVCEKVRFTPARKEIAAELRAHLEDRAEMLTEHGVPPEDAARRAVEAMGNPAEIGAALDKEHDPFWGWTMLVSGVVCMVILFFWGIMLLGGGAVPELYSNETLFYSDWNWTSPSSEVRQEEIPLGVLHKTEDSWIWLERAQVTVSSDGLQVYLWYKTWFKNPLMPVQSDIWCAQIRGGDQVLAQRDSRWVEFTRSSRESTPPECLSLDFVSAAGEPAFTVSVPLGAGGEMS
jgi:hypothetical protein